MNQQDIAPSDKSQAGAQKTASKNTLTDMYIGPGGLRAGWRFFLYLALIALCIFIVRFYAIHVGKGLHSKNVCWDMLISESIGFGVAFIPALILNLLEKRPFGDYGLPLRFAMGRQFWIGVVWGLTAFSALMLALRLIGVYQFGGLAEHGLRAVEFGTFYAGLFLLVGITEEFMLRGYSQFTLAQGIGFWPAAVILSLAFGAIHISNEGEAWIGIAGIIVIGLIFCLTLRRTGNLWFAVGMHAAWDWAESFVFSVANSGNKTPGRLFHASFHGSRWLTGGTVGPEGSVLIFILLPAIWILFDRTHPAKKDPAV